MINELSLYPDIGLNDGHIDKINKLYGTVAQKTLGLGRKPGQIKQIISEMVFSSEPLSRLLKTGPQMLSRSALSKGDNLVIVGRNRASKAATKIARLLKLKK